MTRNASHWYVNSRGSNPDAVRQAIAWLQKGGERFGWRSALLAVPGKRNLDGAVESTIGSRAVKELSSTKQTRIRGLTLHLMTELINASIVSAPVVAVFPTVQLLDKVDALHGPSDVLVVPWTMEEVTSWIQTWSARELGAEEEVPLPSFSNPTVQVALEALTQHINLSTGLAHASDRASAVEMFSILKRSGEAFSPDEVRSWLVRQLGWHPRHANDAADMATKVMEGRRINLTTAGGWARDAVDRWRKTAQERQPRSAG
jgi:hypothetical protein